MISLNASVLGKVLVIGLVASLIVAGVFYFITSTIGFSLIFVFPVIQGVIVGTLLASFLLHPETHKALAWGLIILFSLTIFLFPHFLQFQEINAYVRENVDSEGYIDVGSYLTLLSEQDAEVGKTGRRTINLGNVGFWGLQLLDLVLIFGGMLYGISKRASASRSPSTGGRSLGI